MAEAASRSEQQDRPPPVRPLAERACDTAIFCGGIGSFVGACISTFRFGTVVYGIAVAGVGSAAMGASFIGLRHAIVQGDFEQDAEPVTGLAMGTIATVATTISSGSRAGALSGGVWFMGGCALHHAHRYWLAYRLDRLDERRRVASLQAQQQEQQAQPEANGPREISYGHVSVRKAAPS